ncbi:MAG: carboxypeptidase-like regulatory domain-containing protein, partial [candidate division WOR-3 bacterium]
MHNISKIVPIGAVLADMAMLLTRIRKGVGTMNTGKHLAFLLAVVLGVVGPLAADFDRTSLLIDAPTADVLPPRALVIGLNGTNRFFGADATRNPGLEGGGVVRFGVVKRLEMALTAYTHLDYVLGASYQLVDGGSARPSIAVGVHDIGINAYVSPIGHDTANTFRDEKYVYPDRTVKRAAELGSIFAMASIPVARLGRLHLGVGRGRYVGYSTSRYINTDIIFGKAIPSGNQIALGLIGGAELFLGKYVRLMAEADGRDANVGLKANLGPLSLALAAIKLESPIHGGTGAMSDFHRLAFAVSYRADQLFARRPAHRPPPVPPVPVFGSLSVTVLDQNTRLPIPEAGITVKKAGSPEPITEPGVATNASGVFMLDGIGAGTYVVTAEKPNYSTKTQQAIATAGERAYLEILLEPSVAPVPVPAQPIAGPALHLVPIYFGWDSAN